ncbi:type IV pilus twitching motility protein PilT [Pararhodospirillum oryzae]|uniref:Type II secretion system protein E n=1 Tax=Pararhodospirillum oryzae TaxID=478448 RepID=A0A512H7X0_9PROT|nr:ATPase, T2SS/T4P/T4SS family [Pararhodospirillum oryzae]GEO81556.1 type II secretion system protein E [Pararhodospirillum oryzae]
MSVALPEDLALLLALARARSASDLHLGAGAPPHLRRNGTLIPLESGPIPSESLESFLGRLLDDQTRARLEHDGEVDAVIADTPGGRVRVWAGRSESGPVLVVRLLPPLVPTLEDLHAPFAVRGLAGLREGLVLLTGTAGAGKTTTQAALVDAINRAGGRHVMSVEDPVEIRHVPLGGPITQRQVGRDTESLAQGLRSALRADPDVLVVGEVRDGETLGLALQAAGSGLLVLATLHAPSAPGAVERVLSLFPLERRESAREALAGCLAAAVHQRLLPARNEGRVACFSVMLGTTAVRAAIRDGQERQLGALMDIGRGQGMLPADDDFARLRDSELLPPETREDEATGNTARLRTGRV